MSTCNFSIPFTGDAEIVVAKARTAIESQQGTFTGDSVSGSLEVTVLSNTIKGSYSVMGKNINIDISHKSFLIPCSIIENFLKAKIS